MTSTTLCLVEYECECICRLYQSTLCRYECLEKAVRYKATISLKLPVILNFATCTFRSWLPIYQVFGVGLAIHGVYIDYDGAIECPAGTNPIGFGARSSCYSLADFKVRVLSVIFSNKHFQVQKSSWSCFAGIKNLRSLFINKPYILSRWPLLSFGNCKWCYQVLAICCTILPRPVLTSN